MDEHIVQSKIWEQFKNAYGTQAIRAGGVLYTKHKVPFIPFYYAYCPKVNPKNIDWDNLSKSLKNNKCISINFDVPNIQNSAPNTQEFIESFEKWCVKAPKDTFSKYNVMLDLTLDEQTILANMHKKHRYNIRYASKKGVAVEQGKTDADFETFYELLKNTADRQKYYVRSKKYYKLAWETLQKENEAYILIAKYQDEVLGAWMLFAHNNTLYYPYGGSSTKHRNLHASCLLGWEAIKLGKKLGCVKFDMWGAAKDPQNALDPYHGFTAFKLKYGGTRVSYIDSYDYVVNKPLYTLFNFANKIRWAVLTLVK